MKKQTKTYNSIIDLIKGETEGLSQTEKVVKLGISQPLMWTILKNGTTNTKTLELILKTLNGKMTFEVPSNP